MLIRSQQEVPIRYERVPGSSTVGPVSSAAPPISSNPGVHIKNCVSSSLPLGFVSSSGIESLGRREADADAEDEDEDDDDEEEEDDEEEAEGSEDEDRRQTERFEMEEQRIQEQLEREVSRNCKYNY